MRRRDLHVGWYFVGAGAGVPAALLATVAVTGLAPDLRGVTFAVCILGMLVLAAFSVVAGLRDLDLRWAHLTVGGSMALMTLAIAQAEQSSQALLELYAIQPPLAIYILGRRAALPYLAASFYLYASFLLASDFDGAPVRIAIFIGIILVLSLMLARGQRTVDEFYRATAQLTVVDPLTGVGNLRALRRRVEDEIDRCRVTGGDLSILVIDLDGFKQVNDRYSHTIGDKVLIESARAIGSVVRADELVARRGGDEFAVVCARDNHTDVDALADRISNAVRDARSQLTDGIPTGATVRAVHWNGIGDAEAFMRRSDNVLHDAKAERDSALTVNG
ncbi:MAG: GGDEF domain-containing protein [Actinobacteria bacterium]|nr:GGDEF domain-containing protein [Actinomycetota bacterium]